MPVRLQWTLLMEQNGPSGGRDLCGGLGGPGLLRFYGGLHLLRTRGSTSTLAVAAGILNKTRQDGGRLRDRNLA